jgi:hypothetical protein
MSTKLAFQNGQEIIVLESYEEVDELLQRAYGDGFVRLRRDCGTGEIAVTVNPTTVVYAEGIPELTQIGNIYD